MSERLNQLAKHKINGHILSRLYTFIWIKDRTLPEVPSYKIKYTIKAVLSASEREHV